MRYPQIQDLIHVYTTSWYKNQLGKNHIHSLFSSIRRGIFWVFRNLIYVFYVRHSLVRNEEVENKIWLIVSSKNNYRSLKFLKTGLPNTTFVTTNTIPTIEEFKSISRLSFHRSLKYFFSFPAHFSRIFRQQGKFAFYVTDKICEATGMFEACRDILLKGKPKALIFSNDHTIKNRGLLLAANSLRIPTIYIQHASVSEYFPPLSFTAALLEGEDAKQKYLHIGPTDTKIKLIGMPKFDKYLSKIRKTDRIASIGICPNLLDDKNTIQLLISFLREEFSKLEIFFRPHPRDKREFTFSPIVRCSQPGSESIFDFLSKIDVLIAGDTSTHLEAVLMNIPGIYFNLNPDSQLPDYYGYVKNGLITKADNHRELKTEIEQLQTVCHPVRQRAQYYNATIGTEWDGNSAGLALKYIKDILPETEIG